jgi:protein O-GlcNAc transferase
VSAPPISRNAPCPCGSGKRYKDCHGAIATPTASAASISETSLLDRARSALASGDRAGAQSLWRQVLASNPDDAEANFHIANGHREAGDPQAAISGYERALRAAPGNMAALNNLGLALEAVGEQSRASDCYQRVLCADPQQPDALGNLANAQFERGEFNASANTYDRLSAVRRELPVPIVVRRGIALRKSQRLEEAEASFRQAAARQPDDPQLLTNIGSICIEQGHFSDARQPLARAYELDPSDPYALAMLLHARAHLCQWNGIEELFAELRRMLDRDSFDGAWRVSPLPLLAMPVPPSSLLRAAVRWGRQYAAPYSASRPVESPLCRRRLRVGFTSSDFRPHPMAAVITEVLERIDRRRLETFGFGLVASDTGPIGTRIANAFEHFIDISELSDAQSVQRIRTEGIDVLFDLNGYTRNARPELFARRSAPVQINSIGFPGSLGVDWYDYIHVDRFVAPPWTQEQYSERFFLMPHSYYASDTVRASAARPPTRAACDLPDDAFVYCSFNNSFKILPDVFAIWLRLLAATPRSVLWLLDANADVRSNLRGEAARAGVAPERLVFAAKVPSAEHIARNACADLFLDTAPYGAHTTANDALLVGLPVLTCAGETFASRVAGSQLHAIGLPELVTSTFADYEALALALARDPARLAELRARLARNRQTQPLFDMAGYARDFEDGLIRIWQEHAAVPPAVPREGKM